MKNGDQKIIGGDLRSDGPSSEDCFIVHKGPHTVSIEGVSATSTTKGPAISVFQGARVLVKDSKLKSEFSSAVHIDSTAGNGSSLIDSVIEGGGEASKALVDVRGGHFHVIRGNIFYGKSGIQEVRLFSPDAAKVENNKSQTTPF